MTQTKVNTKIEYTAADTEIYMYNSRYSPSSS